MGTSGEDGAEGFDPGFAEDGGEEGASDGVGGRSAEGFEGSDAELGGFSEAVTGDGDDCAAEG